MILTNIYEFQAMANKYAHIYIYGTGAYGLYLFEKFRELGITIEGFIVSDEYYVASSKNKDINVFEFSEYQVGDSDIVIIGIYDDKNLAEVRAMVSKYKNVVEFDRVHNKWYFYSETELVSYSRSTGYFSDNTILQSIGEEEGTDKSSVGHNYCNKYEFFLNKYKDSEITFVELGVFHGASIKMWRRFFSKAKIIGIDINDSCKQYQNEGIDIYIKDLGQDSSIDFIEELKPTVIVDDASHLWSHQINALFKLFPTLPSGGIYILEDICTSFYPLSKSYSDNDVSAYRIIEAICSGVVGNSTLYTESKDISKYMPPIRKIIENTETVVSMRNSVILIKR